jgi:hypothetical protein
LSLEQQIADNQRNIRTEVLMRRVLHLLQDTVQLQGVAVDTKIDDVVARMTDDSAKVIAPLIEAVEILEEIIFASDGCRGHKDCVHSMEPWQRARALLHGKWESDTGRGQWPRAGTEPGLSTDAAAPSVADTAPKK